MRNHKDQNFVIETIPIKIIKVDHRTLAPSEQKEFDRFLKAARKIKARGPVLVTRNQSGEVRFIAGGLQLAVAQEMGAESTLCAVFDVDVPDALADLTELFPAKKTYPIEVAELIVLLHDTLGFSQTELATLVKTTKSTICELYSLKALSDDVKADRRTDQAVPPTQLVEIAQLPADKQGEAYREAKKKISDRRTNSEGQIQDDLKELCDLFLRVANKGTRFQVRLSSAASPLAECEKKELYTATNVLMNSLFGLKGFVEPNPFKNILRSFLRNMV